MSGSPEVTFDDEMATWVAWDDETLVHGFGQSADEAVADYRDNVADQYARFNELGRDKVSARLWATLPALRQALGIT